MAQENLICIYQCLDRQGPAEGQAERLLGEEGASPAQSYFILYALGPRGLLDRAVLEEAMEDLMASRQRSEETAPRPTFKDAGESLRLGPFAGLSGVEAMALSLADRVNAPTVAMLGAHEYNSVVESMAAWDGQKGSLFDALFAASQPLQDQERKSKKGLLGKIFN